MDKLRRHLCKVDLTTTKTRSSTPAKRKDTSVETAENSSMIDKLDSGATFHITKDASILAPFNESNTSICLADGNQISSAGVGSAKFCGVNDKDKGVRVKMILNNVLHVPTLEANLLSVSKIADLGISVWFGKTECKILKGDEVLIVGR